MGVHGVRDADCHSQCAHWLRNDTLQGVRCKPGRADRGVRPYGSATRGAVGGRPQGSPLRKGYKGCNGRATARVAPTEALQGVRWGGLKTKSSPAFAKDDALHRGTTLLRGLLTQAAL